MNSHVPPPQISASAEPDFRVAIESFFAGVVKISNDYMDGSFPNLARPVFELENLRVRYRINRDRSAFCFVDKATGDVLKAASWAAPAKHARGNIFDPHNGLKSIGPYGPAYLR